MKLSDVKVGKKYIIGGDCPEEASITGAHARAIHREGCYRHRTVTVLRLFTGSRKAYIMPNIHTGFARAVDLDELFQV